MDIFFILLLLSVVFYWLDSIRVKEIATKQAAVACEKVALEFLDQSVAINKVRLRRDGHGRLKFYREYQFEFSSTGEFRYKGIVQMLGHYPINIEMEAYQFDNLNES